MAITAVVTLDDESAATGQRLVATVTVANSGGASVNVLSITLTAVPSGKTSQSVAVNFGQPPLSPPQLVSVAASGERAFSLGVVALAPRRGSGISQVYTVGAVVQTSDGATTYATPATLTVTAPSL